MANILKILILCGAGLLFSCAGSQKRADILPEEKMIGLLVDIHIMEARLETQKIAFDSLAVLTAKNYGYIFKEHGVEAGQFYNTLEYYEMNPEEMDELYAQVVNELSRQEAHMSGNAPEPELTEKERASRHLDSLMRNKLGE